MNYTKRARVFTGTGCDANCRFCYYYLNKKHNFWPEERIKKELRILKDSGMNAVDFSGGEPTIHPSFLKLVEYAESLGFETICTLTNGMRLSCYDFVERMKTAGVNDVLFSVHGYNSEEHDYITQVEGSFNKLLKGVKNVKRAGIPFRINCTVTRINYKNLLKHASLYKKLRPKQVNFILFNPFETASGLSDEYAVKYSEACKYIKKAVDELSDFVDYVNVRYVPFCFMKGYEEHVTNYPQKVFDPYEWSQRMLIRLPSNKVTSLFEYYSKLLYYVLKTRPNFEFGKGLFEDACMRMRMKEYVKPKECESCKYESVCEGLEETYINKFGTGELEPEDGRKIRNPLYYRTGFYKNWKRGFLQL